MRRKKPLRHHLHDYFFPHARNNHRPHFFAPVSVAIFTFGLLFLEGAYLADLKVVFKDSSFLSAVLPGVLVSLTNDDRVANNVPVLMPSALLDQAAALAAHDMAENGYFAHVSPDGKDPWYWLSQVGYRYSYAGQNLAVNFTDSVDVERAWMASPTHHANIVKPEYREIGFGVAEGTYQGRTTTFVVQFFATPAVAAPAVRAALVPVKPSVPTSPVFSSTTVASSSPIVLGTEEDATTPPIAAASASVSWFDKVLASPVTTVEAIATALFALVALLLSIAVLVKVRIQHASVIIGGFFLLTGISLMLLVNQSIRSSVEVPSTTEGVAQTAAI